MARYKNGINGAFRGKVGTVVGASWRGIDYVRGVADTSKVIWSEAQINQRVLFALVVNWLKPLWSVINLGYQVFKKRKTPLNAAIGYHMKEAVKGEAPDFEIEFSKAIFSVGELLLSLIKELVALGDAMLRISWDNIAESVYNSGSDRAIFILYNPDKQLFVSFVYCALRAHRQVLLQLPEGFAGDAVHCYMFFTNEKGDKVSTSQYLGEVVVV
ncbi:MAG TPA: DUF6266 family protein [Pedobacter sp.]|uniref:DUF6266 family protein n=1 Tax=Pedobacter sp. TaxID=1411316 RepID=UPI002B5E267C|nr:DUF6266 family protein [Pedobacter sp.]HMI04491.1 DUF6266 family protein [Pedobacter sp.]